MWFLTCWVGELSSVRPVCISREWFCEPAIAFLFTHAKLLDLDNAKQHTYLPTGLSWTCRRRLAQWYEIPLYQEHCFNQIIELIFYT